MERNKNTLTSSTLSIKALLHTGPPLSLFFQRHRGRRRSSTASNGFPGNANLFLCNTSLPDLVQQSASPLVSPGEASGAQVGGADSGPKKSFLRLTLPDRHPARPARPVHLLINQQPQWTSAYTEDSDRKYNFLPAFHPSCFYPPSCDPENPDLLLNPLPSGITQPSANMWPLCLFSAVRDGDRRRLQSFLLGVRWSQSVRHFSNRGRREKLCCRYTSCLTPPSAPTMLSSHCRSRQCFTENHLQVLCRSLRCDLENCPTPSHHFSEMFGTRKSHLKYLNHHISLYSFYYHQAKKEMNL